MSLKTALGFSEFILRMGKPSAQVIYEFDDFRLDVGHLMLYRGEEELQLAPKAVETLVALVEHRGSIIGKDELLEKVWPDAIVEESNLFLYLSVLRKTLGTQKNGKPWVETLRRRGYRFSGDVRVLPIEDNGSQHPARSLHLVSENSEHITANTTPPRTDTTPKSPTRGVGRSVYASAGLIAVVIALAFAYSYFFDQRQIKSIAVVPFANDDAELEYLSDGMTDNLIGSLLKIPGLEVKASSTMFRYKGRNLDAATIGKELNVQAVISPRIIQRGDDLTLYVELVDTQTENSLWQQTYNRKTSQLGVLQRDVIRDVVRELSLDLTDSTKQRLARNYSESAEATRLYLKGLHLIRKITEPQIREGLVYLWQATEHDPSYAPAYAMIASAHRSLTLCCDTDPSEFLEAKAAAQKAVELDENLSEAHSALGSNLFVYDWNFTEAETHFLRALELDPKSAMSHFLYGDFLGRMDRRDEAAAEKKRAIELEPFSPFFNTFALHHGDPNTALERARFVIDLDPTFHFSHFMVAVLYHQRKMYPEAEAEYRKAKELSPEQTWSDVSLSRLLVDMGDTAQARAMLDELLRRSESRYVPPFHIASVYNHLGETEQALAWLEKGYQVRDPKMTLLKTMPAWKKLDADPRYQDIKRRVGL